MAETATRPARSRAARATKAAPATPTPKAEVTTDSATGTVNRVVLTLEHAGDTKNYAKFAVPEGAGCVGSLYVPLGTKSVKVAISGDAE